MHNKAAVLTNSPRNLLSLCNTIVWENPNLNHILIKADAKTVEFCSAVSSAIAKDVIHATSSNQIMFCANKIKFSTCCINVHKKHSHWCLNWEAVNQVSRSVLGNITKTAARA